MHTALPLSSLSLAFVLASPSSSSV
jgi:hypothetical protein